MAISFGTDGWRAHLDEFTDERVRQVARAVGRYLQDEGTEGNVVVGYDPRESSEGFAVSVADELSAAGFDVVLPDRDVPTPVVAWAVVDREAAGAVMITASHNPPEHNGVKFMPSDGAPALPAVTDGIEARLGESPRPGDGEVERADLRGPYLDRAVSFVDTDLSGLTVAYDAMHGSGRGVTDELLSALGADVVRLRCDHDPTFGGGQPDPSREHLVDLVSRVGDGVDLGVANDGDADRIALVAPEAGYLDGNRVLALLYDHLLEDDAGPAVRTVSTTFLIDRIADAHGEEVVETPVGFKWVAESMADHGALVGGEESGGHAVRGWTREKDGVLIAGVLAAAARLEPVDDRLDRMATEYGAIAADRRSVDCPDEKKERVIDALGRSIPNEVAGEPVSDVVTLDGFKLLLEGGSWLLVRPSGTESKMRVYAEGESDQRVKELLDAGTDLVARFVP